MLQWWIADGTDWPLLQNFALRVFVKAASSAASERNFSTFDFIHSKLRNRLSPEKVKKLVNIKTNTLQMTDQPLEYYESDGKDDDESIKMMEVDEADLFVSCGIKCGKGRIPSFLYVSLLIK